jgi:hypothetical protein
LLLGVRFFHKTSEIDAFPVSLRKQAGAGDALDENHGVSVPGTAGLAKDWRGMARMEFAGSPENPA